MCVLKVNLYINFAGKPGFSKKAADLFFPPDFADDFPVAMQVYFHLLFVVFFSSGGEPH